ncbi:MAG: EutN/CcmL family microcompartment protein [Actinobacteria bacterium]|jgi:microcompartment protein CcmK/EutM|nr:EutN/CcmL family microcompartment protein [Cyanobacteriota bacterium]MCL5772128.1 EutN/CcmL family microcompartment protein [Actinomycetota bacterium]
MVLGKVIGSVVATQKDESLVGKKLMLVKAIDLEGNLLEPFVVAVDVVGVGIGEKVLVVNGSSARMTDETRERSIDSVIVAKVDSINIS